MHQHLSISLQPSIFDVIRAYKRRKQLMRTGCDVSQVEVENLESLGTL